MGAVGEDRGLSKAPIVEVEHAKRGVGVDTHAQTTFIAKLRLCVAGLINDFDLI